MASHRLHIVLHWLGGAATHLSPPPPDTVQLLFFLSAWNLEILPSIPFSSHQFPLESNKASQGRHKEKETEMGKLMRTEP